MNSMNPHQYLDSLTNYESFLHTIKPEDFRLDRIVGALESLGNPQSNLKIIHVAGTKGKGSTCAMIASILAQAGFKVGLYTSPHLHRVNERIRILDQSTLHHSDDFSGSISDERLNQILGLIRPVLAGIENNGSFLTYFEILTLTAALYFSQEHVDMAVFETGLGGRLDATNAFESLIAVITPISLDHTKILGNSLKKIAEQKAGIIKSPYQKVVIAPQDPVVQEILKDHCHEFAIVPTIVHPMEYRYLTIALKGEHQMTNAACAFEVVRLLQQMNYTIPPEAIEQGFKNVRWQGRFEVIQKKPTIVVDGAHNPAASEALAKTIQDEYPRRKVILILGSSADKDIKALCEPLKLISQTIIVTKAKHPRSHKFTKKEAQEIFAGKELFLTDNMKEALKLAVSKSTKDDVILVTGSLFVVAEARECINTKA